MVTDNLTELEFMIDNYAPDIIIVDGYNGVGKSRVLEHLSKGYNAPIYRPDYNKWSSLMPRELRWTHCATILDFCSQVGINRYSMDTPIILDRGFFSFIYNEEDLTLSDYYKKFESDLKILNILVSCDESSYEAFLTVRGSSKELTYSECERYTQKYRESYERAGATYIEFRNVFSIDIGREHLRTCRGCSHFNISDSYCKHPLVLKEVSPEDIRCEYTSEMEVQDNGLYVMSSK